MSRLALALATILGVLALQCLDDFLIGILLVVLASMYLYFCSGLINSHRKHEKVGHAKTTATGSNVSGSAYKWNAMYIKIPSVLR